MKKPSLHVSIVDIAENPVLLSDGSIVNSMYIYY